MTPQQLLQPRFEVIAPWPNMPSLVKVGHIFTPIKQGSNYYQSEENDALIGLPNECPANLRPLHWSEKREIGDMPEWLKGCESGRVVKVVKWEMGNDKYYRADLGNHYWYAIDPDIIPATETDYLNYINANK